MSNGIVPTACTCDTNTAGPRTNTDPGVTMGVPTTMNPESACGVPRRNTGTVRSIASSNTMVTVRGWTSCALTLAPSGVTRSLTASSSSTEDPITVSGMC
jgi:hypothetical protein